MSLEKGQSEQMYKGEKELYLFYREVVVLVVKFINLCWKDIVEVIKGQYLVIGEYIQFYLLNREKESFGQVAFVFNKSDRFTGRRYSGFKEVKYLKVNQ